MNKPVSIMPPATIEVVKIGDAHAIILSPDVLATLGVAEGDRFDLVDDADGLALRKHDRTVDRQLSVAREVMKERRAALRELAK